jgi:hypothetical protein
MTTRRTFLRGVALGAGATVLQPVLRRLEAQAAGNAGALPKRVVFVVESNGLFPHHVQPTGLDRPKGGADRLVDESLAARSLPEAISPLAPFKDRITILQGLSGRIAEGGTGGHSTNYGGLGCYPGNKGPMAQTIDAALAAAFPGIIPHVGLGIHSRPEVSVYYSVSATGAGKPLPIQCRPELAARSLFGSVAGGNARASFDLRTTLLDHLAGDVKRVRGALAGPEKDRLDSYLEAFESLRDRQSRIARIEEALKRNTPPPDAFQSPVETDRLEGQFDLAAAALISGLTNVVTIASGGGGQHYITYTGLGIPIDGHSIGHGKGVEGKTPEECRVLIRKFHAGLIAKLAGKLRAAREGDGSMLDRTLIVYLSDSGESHHPNLKEWPVLLLGDLGGTLRTRGRLLEYPRYQSKGHPTLANLYLALLSAAGRPRESFGFADPGLKDVDFKGPLGELLA